MQNPFKANKVTNTVIVQGYTIERNRNSWTFNKQENVTKTRKNLSLISELCLFTIFCIDFNHTFHFTNKFKEK